MQKNLDKTSCSAVSCGQVALNPRVIERNLTEIQVFLRPQYERTVGCVGNIIPRKGEYPRRSLLRFKTPGTLESAILENNRGNTMSQNLLSSHPDVCPHELLSSCQHRLSFFTTMLHGLLCSEDAINIKHPCNIDGIYYTLHSIADDIEKALSILASQEVTQ